MRQSQITELLDDAEWVWAYGGEQICYLYLLEYQLLISEAKEKPRGTRKDKGYVLKQQQQDAERIFAFQQTETTEDPAECGVGKK